MIERKPFDTYQGREVTLYVLRAGALEVGITDFGAAIQYFIVRTPRGTKDICLGYPTIEERIRSGTYCGATIGRVANRIGGAKFALNGQTISLVANEGNNCHHGGAHGFDEAFFETQIKGQTLIMTHVSQDGDQGFPGELKLSVSFTVNKNTLSVRYTAVSDKDTVWAPTCHAYFNLNGEDSGNVADTKLRINAQYITLCNAEHVSTGAVAKVGGTPFDFTSFKRLGDGIDGKDEQLTFCGGYDQNYVLAGSNAAVAMNEESGIILSLETDLPGLHFYSGNYIRGMGKHGQYFPRDGFCLEPQFFPNAVNIDKFLKPILRAGKKKNYYVNYKIDVM